MELRELLTTLGRRWKFVVAVFLSGLLGALLVTLVMTPMHEASVRVYLSASGNEVFDQVQMGMYTSQRAKSYAALADDAAVREDVIARAEVDTTAEDLAGRTDIEVVPDTVVIRLAVRDSDPEVARKLADAYAAEIASTVTRLERPTAVKAGDRPASPITARPQSKASVSNGPVSPDWALNLGIGALLGLLFGIGGAVVREVLATDPDGPPPVRWPTPGDSHRALVP